MNQAVFVPLTDELLDTALKEDHPQLIPYSYQQTCYRALLEASESDANRVSVSEQASFDRSYE